MKALLNDARMLAILIFQVIALQAATQVIADFTAVPRSGCRPLVVNFQNNSTGATSYQWYFGNGNSSTLVNPAVIYANPGKYTITLIASNGTQSDTVVKQDFIEVFHDPQADFDAPVTSGCAPFALTFQDRSIPGSGSIRAWIWNFGDGSSSNLRNPSKVYHNAGSYNVTLLVVDQNGCSHSVTKSHYVVVQAKPTAQFSAPVRSACVPPLTVNFQDNSTSSSSGLTYLWSFGDGNTSTQHSPTHTYTSLGSFDVKLKVTTSLGCADSIVKPAFVMIQDLVADFTANHTTGCAPLTVNFSNSTTPAPNSVRWDFGDGTTSTAIHPTKTYSTPGTYTVKLVAFNSSSCSDSIVKNAYITVHPAPVAQFSANNTAGCSVPFLAAFTDQSTGAVSWNWNFGDGNTSGQQHPVHTYQNMGNYTVSLTVTNTHGCSNTFTRNNYIQLAPPSISFTADTLQGCFPLRVNFTASIVSIEPVQSYLWNFGDGNTSTLANPSHVYYQEGEYTVSLTITTVSGCVASLTRNNFIRAGSKPNADFIGVPQTVCLFAPVAFTNLTDSTDQWLWTFGDGGMSSAFSPSHIYGDTGVFTVQLIAFNKGCTDTMIKTDYIYVFPPRADFRVIRDCDNPYVVQFRDSSLAPDTWFWDFGDGTTSTLQHPTHTYTSKGTFTATLVVTDTTTGCYDDMTFPVLVVDVEADFSAAPVSGCHPLTVQMTDASTDYNTFYWTTGGMSSTQRNPSFTYTVPGIYDVQLIVTDLLGCSDTLLMPDLITVLGPTAVFDASPRNGCAPLSVDFTDSSYSFLGTITSWSWNFGDGNTADVQHPSHFYQNPGNYTVALTVTDDNGCADTRNIPDFIRPTFPTPAFSADTFSCSSRAIVFNNTSSGVGLTYLWDFGDGNTSDQANPSHHYAQEGIYTVSLKVTDINGCDSMITKTDYIRISNPVADFVADTVFSPCPPLMVNFTNQSTPDIISFQWNFGDGNTSTLANPSNVYLTPDTFDVRLIGTTAIGCKDTVIKYDLILVLGPDGTFTFDPSNNCLGNKVTFTAQTTNTQYISWDFGDGIVEVNSNDTVIKIYDNYGVYIPTIILDDGQGCVRAITSQDSVLIGELEPAFVKNMPYICKQGPVQFVDISSSYPDITSWQWDFGDGHTSNTQNPNHTYTVPGTYTVKLTVSNGVCTKTIEKPDHVYIDPGPDANFSVSQDKGCASLSVYFNDMTSSDSTLTAWSWNFGNGNHSSMQNPSQTFGIGQFDVQLIVTASTGCADTVSRTITVYEPPVVVASADTGMCYGETYQMHATGAVFYSWSPASYLSASHISNPSATPRHTINYVVTGTDSNGCAAYDTVTITIHPLPEGQVVADRNVCVGDNAELWASGGIDYEWTPAASLNNAFIASPVASTTTTTTYVVKITNEFRCAAFDTVTVFVHPYPQGITKEADTLCYGQSVVIETSGGNAFQWSPVTALSCNDCASPQATPFATTTYRLTITNEHMCTLNDSITIVVNPNAAALIQGPENVCLGDKATLTASGGNAYLWMPAQAVNCENCHSVIISPNETTTYIVWVNNEYNCPAYDTFTVTVRPLPEVSTINDIKLCKGDKVQLHTETTGAVSQYWTPTDGLDNAAALSPFATPSATQTYKVTAVSPFGCTRSDSVTITIINKVKAAIEGDLSICKGESTQLIADIIEAAYTGAQVVWTPVNYLSSPTELAPYVIKPERTTEYRLIAYSGSCEPDTQYVSVVVNELPRVTIVRDRKVSIGTNINLSIETNSIIDEIVWGPSHLFDCTTCENPHFVATTSQTVIVEVTDNNGCKNTDQAVIDVVGRCGDDVYVPNIFTPNNDEINDKIYVRNLSLEGLKVFRIFDRWGRLVFETTNIEEGWDGTYNGKNLNSGVFAYYVDVICSNGQTTRKSGNITLIR
jgi:gliding motility-associated-like protein